MKFPLNLLVFALATAAHAQEPLAPPAAPGAAPVAGPAPAFSVDLQCVTIPQAQALPLVAKFRSHKPADETAAIAEIAALLEKGTAKLIGWPTLTTWGGQKSRSEQTEEVRYPTEFTAGSASVYFTDNEGTATKQPSQVRGADVQPVASAFETRNLGLVLEVEPSLSGDQIQLAFVASHVVLKSIDRWAIEHEFTSEKKTEKVIQEQPRFLKYAAENLTFLKSGEHKLVGVFKTADPEPTLELFIISAEILDHK